MRRVFHFLFAVTLTAGCSGSSGEESHDAAKAVLFSVGNVDVRVDKAAAAAFEETNQNVEDTLSEQLRRLDELIPVSSIAVSISGDPDNVIDEVGVYGRTTRIGDVRIFIDQTRTDLPRVLNVWLPQMMAHEVMHSSRMLAGAGDRSTLLGHFIEEGLADKFSLEAFPSTPRIPWAKALSREEVLRWWKEAIPELESRDSDLYAKWFFDGDEIPYWAGYAIGFALVGSFLDRTNSSPSAALDVGPKEILRRSEFSPTQVGGSS